ncbi:MAG: peptidoglycan-binding domain-containing protein [Arachnia sp.]
MRITPLRRALVALAVAIGSLGVVVGSASPAEAATPCVQKLYRYGARGDCVRYIQALANYHRAGGPIIAVDGVWGSKTDASIRHIQRTWAVLKVDGIVGRQTWGVLCAPAMGDDRYPGRVPSWFPLWAARGAGCPGADGWYQ